MKHLFVIGAVAGLLSGAACAAPCYAPAEIEADQAIRLRAELKVIADRCNDPSYSRFVERNRDTLSAYEQLMTEHFGREFAGAGEAAVQTYSAGLEREVKLRAYRTPNFCAEALETVTEANYMRPEQLRSYAAAQAEVAHADYPLCPPVTNDREPVNTPPPAPTPSPQPNATAAASPPEPPSSPGQAVAPPPPSPSRDAAAPLSSSPTPNPGDAEDDGLVGVLAGSELARMLDPVDRQRLKDATQQALETSVSGQVVGWRNPFSRNAGTVVVARAFRNVAGQWCRGIEQSVTISSETRRGRGTACRRSDGWWDIQP